jgi:hypothetical protein
MRLHPVCVFHAPPTRPQQKLSFYPIVLHRLLYRMRGKREEHLWHVRNLRLRVADISLNKEGQNSPNPC